MADNVPAPESSAKPKPAVGQIWRYGSDRARILLEVNPRSGIVQWDADGRGRSIAHISEMLTSHNWRCVGVETPHGSVMVGQRRREPYGKNLVHTIIAIEHSDGDDAVATHDGVRSYGDMSASHIATWPLITEPAKPERYWYCNLPVGTGICPMCATPIPPRPREYADPALDWDRATLGGIPLPTAAVAIPRKGDVVGIVKGVDASGRIALAPPPIPHVIDATGAWCTRCGAEPREGACSADADDVRARTHWPRNGGPCPGCATCRPMLYVKPNEGAAMSAEKVIRDALLYGQASYVLPPGVEVEVSDGGRWTLCDDDGGSATVRQINDAMRDLAAAGYKASVEISRQALAAMGLPTPGSLRWFAAETARILVIPESEVSVKEEPGKGAVIVRLPSKAVSGRAFAVDALRRALQHGAPDCIMVSVEVDPEPDPRAVREQRRREIDVMTRGESAAMRCALLAALEDSEVSAEDVANVPLFIARLRAYEAARTKGMTSERAALEMLPASEREVSDEDRAIVAIYERARSLP